MAGLHPAADGEETGVIEWAKKLLLAPDMAAMLETQRRVLEEFHARCVQVLGDSCGLRPYEKKTFSIEKNLFSTLFLAAQHGLGVSEDRLLFCGLVNQCMRAWVTGCDNILDDEFKSVMPFDLNAGGFRFQSVLTIMTADRIFTDLIVEEMATDRLSEDEARELSHLTLRVLVPSGLQEHEEENGAEEILSPEAILKEVHVAKTGLLFEAPIAVAEWVAKPAKEKAMRVREGLRDFGLACQILDDIVDFELDVANRRHNYLLSTVAWEGRSESALCPRYGEFDPSVEDLKRARKKACRSSQALFRHARECLGEAIPGLDGGAWNALVFAIPVLLHVPDRIRALFEDGEFAGKGTRLR